MWCELNQSVVNHAIDEWRRRLSACVDAEGGHFEIRPVNLINGDDFLFSFAVNVNEQRMIAFLTEKYCYLNLRTYTK